MTSVELRALHKHYVNYHALRDVNAQIEGGEFVVLVGPSGCGKSTLLRMIAGLEDVSDGEIVIGGQVVNDMPSKDRDIAMVFQNYALYPHMTVFENMAFSMKLRRADKAEVQKRVSDAAVILGLTEQLQKYPRQLSGGQRQRVAMGRAIVRSPRVFLFDEPLSNLDAKLRVRMRAEIRALHDRLGNTMIYVTHDQVEAMTMADKIVVMQGGVIEQIGAPLDLYDRPANMFVAGFIGSPAMNLLEGSLVADGFRLADGTVLPLPADFARPADAPSALHLGIRPESFRLAAGGRGFNARVSMIEPTGAESHVGLQLGTTAATAVLRDRLHVQRGEELALKLAPEGLHLFDSATGLRLG